MVVGRPGRGSVGVGNERLPSRVNFSIQIEKLLFVRYFSRLSRLKCNLSEVPAQETDDIAMDRGGTHV